MFEMIILYASLGTLLFLVLYVSSSIPAAIEKEKLKDFKGRNYLLLKIIISISIGSLIIFFYVIPFSKKINSQDGSEFKIITNGYEGPSDQKEWDDMMKKINQKILKQREKKANEQ